MDVVLHQATASQVVVFNIEGVCVGPQQFEPLGSRLGGHSSPRCAGSSQAGHGLPTLPAHQLVDLLLPF